MNNEIFLADAADFFQPGGWFFTILIIVICLVVLVVSLLAFVFAKKAAKAVTTTNLKLTAKLSYDSETFSEYLEISVYNNNFRDVTLKDFGFRYKDQTVSLIQEFIERKLTKSHAIVPARESITYKMNPERVEKFVVSHNFNANSIAPIYVFALDTVGNETVIKEKALSSVFNARQKARIQIAKRQIHQEKVQAYKDNHDGNEPYTEGLYRRFHRKQVKIPDIMRRSEALMRDKTITPEKSKDNTSFNPAPVSKVNTSASSFSSSSSSNYGSSSSKMDTRDMKVTFLDLDFPLKSQEETESDKKSDSGSTK